MSPSKHAASCFYQHWSQWPLESESLSQGERQRQREREREREEKKGKKGSTFSNWTSKHTKSHTECVEGEKSTVLNLHSIDGSVRFWSLSTLANCTHTHSWTHTDAHTKYITLYLCMWESDWLTDWVVCVYVCLCVFNCNYTQHNSLFTAHTYFLCSPLSHSLETSGISLCEQCTWPLTQNQRKRWDTIASDWAIVISCTWLTLAVVTLHKNKWRWEEKIFQQRTVPACNYRIWCG